MAKTEYCTYGYPRYNKTRVVSTIQAVQYRVVLKKVSHQSYLDLVDIDLSRSLTVVWQILTTVRDLERFIKKSHIFTQTS